MRAGDGVDAPDDAVRDHHRHHPREAVVGAAVDGEELQARGREPHADDARADVASAPASTSREREQLAQPLGLGALREELLPLDARAALTSRESSLARSLRVPRSADVAVPRAERAARRAQPTARSTGVVSQRMARSSRERSLGLFACAKNTPSGTRSSAATSSSSRYRFSSANTRRLRTGPEYPCILAPFG